MSVCFCPTSEGRTLLCFTFLSLPSQTEQLCTLAFRWAAGDVNNNRTQSFWSPPPQTHPCTYYWHACCFQSEKEKMLCYNHNAEDVWLRPLPVFIKLLLKLIPLWLYVQQACEVLFQAIYRAVSLPSPGLWPWRECDKWQAAFQPFQQWQQVGGGEKKIMPSARASFCLPVKYHFSLPRESLTATAVPGSQA